MGLVIDWVIIDCEDVETMSAFWSAALDFDHVRTGPLGGHVLAAKDGSKRRLAMFPVRSRKESKNRVHLDLRPDDQAAEVRRLEGLGATKIDIGQDEVPWVVMADPEGNEFCVLRAIPDHERESARWGD
jgi:predicted enzyme related to lactoylglutathione lyase